MVDALGEHDAARRRPILREAFVGVPLGRRPAPEPPPSAAQLLGVRRDLVGPRVLFQNSA
jgi:hypothetical protein